MAAAYRWGGVIAGDTRFAWWGPIVAGAGFAAMAFAYDRVRTVIGVEVPTQRRERMFAALWFVAIVALTALAGGNPIALSIAGVATFVARAASEPADRARWVASLIALIGGLAVVGLMVRVGAIRFVHPNALGMPRWIDAVILHGALWARAEARAGRSETLA